MMKRYILSALFGGAVALGLNADNYKVVVSTEDGEDHYFETTDLSKITFEEAPDYIELPYLYSATYRTQGDLGVYTLNISTGPMNEYGIPAGSGDLLLDIDLVAPLSEDRVNPVLPEGYYRVGTDNTPFSWLISSSALYLPDPDRNDELTPSVFIGGTVDVKKKGNSYVIKFELQLLSGERVDFLYDGPVPLSLSSLETDEFSSDINVEFTGAQGRFYSNWYYPFCSDMLLQFYTGQFNPDGVQEEGYWLQMPIYMPLASDPMNPVQTVADGVYVMDVIDRTNSQNYIPYTYSPGTWIDMMGIGGPTGSYITYVDPNGINKRAFLKEGTMTVSGNGTKIEFDIVTDTPGVALHASFSGDVLIRNFCDNDKTAPDMTGTIATDYTMDFSKGQLGVIYPLGETITKGLTVFEIQLTDPNYMRYDFLQLTLLAEGNLLPDGTYTIDNSLTAFSGVKGVINPAGLPIFGWMSNLSEVDAEGYQAIIAPLHGGTVTIKTNSVLDDSIDYTLQVSEKTIELNLLDEKGDRITGTFTGRVIEMAPESDDTDAGYDEPAIAPLRVAPRK